MRHPRIAVPACLALALGPAACGSQALSKSEYVKQADAICQQVNDEGDKLPDPKGIADLGALADKAKPLLEDEIARLRDLKVPDELKEKAGQAYDLLDQQADNLGRLKDAASDGDPAKITELATETGSLSEKAGVKARELGLRVCGSGT